MRRVDKGATFQPSPSFRRPLHNLSHQSVEEEFPHLYAHGCTLRDVCAECTKFIADVISSSRRSLDVLNNTPKREARAAVTERPQPQRGPHLKAGAQPESPQDHLQPGPQSNYQQQSLRTSLVSSSPQLSSQFINSAPTSD